MGKGLDPITHRDDGRPYTLGDQKPYPHPCTDIAGPLKIESAKTLEKGFSSKAKLKLVILEDRAVYGKLYVPSLKGKTGTEVEGEDKDMPEAGVELTGNEIANFMDPEAHTHKCGGRILAFERLFLVDDGEVSR